MFIFTDDHKYTWSVNYIFNEFDFEMVSDGKITPTQEFELMKNCKHFLLSNSTFNWWAMWLSEFKNKMVIAPFPVEKKAEFEKDWRKFYLDNHIIVNPYTID